MRLDRKAPAKGVLLLLLWPSSLAAQQQFFPKSALDPFLVSWFSRELTVLKEPSLWQLSQSDKAAEVYRFVWLRTFDHPVAVRIVVNPDGRGTATTKASSGTAGFHPGHPIEDKTTGLSAAQVRAFLVRLKTANYWALAAEDSAAPRGCDGAEWILEGARNGKYHVVDRWSPDKGSYRSLCLYVLRKLSSLRVPRSKIY